MPKIDIPLEALIADLHGSDWQKRCDAARLLGQSGDSRAVEALLPDLQDSDWRVRRNAAQALGALKSSRAVEALLQALKDRTATVRERAAVALGRIKDPQTIPALVAAVIEKQESGLHVNEGAYQAVRKFGRKAGPALVEALKEGGNIYLVELLADSKYETQADFFIALAGSNEPAMQRTAFKALGGSKDPRATRFLLEALEGADLKIQVLAVQSLAQLRAVEAAPRLLDLLEDNQLEGPRVGLYRAISVAFQQFSGIAREVADSFPLKSSLSFGVAGGSASLAEMMGRLGDEGFQKLNQMLTEAEDRAGGLQGKLNLPPEMMRAVADQTWKFGAMLADGRDAKAEHLKTLVGLLKAGVPLERAAAALSLPWYMDAQALGPLEQAGSDPDEIVRRAAAWARAALANALGQEK